MTGFDGIRTGRVGESKVPTWERGALDFGKFELLRAIQQAKKSTDGEAALSRREHIPPDKIEEAISFWKPIYFSRTIEGRHLNGIEAYELGDPSKTNGGEVERGPYIAMCNLMALEAIRMLGDNMPTAEDPNLFAFATENEREIADFWKKNFAPTKFQAEWAWHAALAVLSGSEIAYDEMLVNYKEQLP